MIEELLFLKIKQLFPTLKSIIVDSAAVVVFQYRMSPMELSGDPGAPPGQCHQRFWFWTLKMRCYLGPAVLWSPSPHLVFGFMLGPALILGRYAWQSCTFIAQASPWSLFPTYTTWFLAWKEILKVDFDLLLYCFCKGERHLRQCLVPCSPEDWIQGSRPLSHSFTLLIIEEGIVFGLYPVLLGVYY